jgi:PTS system nitrogen regulatory IIA component
MELTVRDAARVLKVSESEIFRLVSKQALPAEQVHGIYRFNRVALLEWATARQRELSPDLFSEPNGSGGAAGYNLHEALRAGGVFYNVKGTDKESVLRAVVQAMPLPPAVDRAFLLEVLLSRETLGSTGIGHGIAVPHPHYPVVLPLDRPFISLCFLEQPIPYSAHDRQPVHTLFVLFSPTVRVHLDLLARLSSALTEPAFRDLLRGQGSAADILEHVRSLEEALAAARSKTPAEAK